MMKNQNVKFEETEEGERERGSYGFDEESSAFTRPDKRDGCTLSFQLFTHIVRVKLQESVVVVEESYEKYICWKIERTCKEFVSEAFRSLYNIGKTVSRRTHIQGSSHKQYSSEQKCR